MITPPQPPPLTPFRQNYYVPPTSSGSGKRWAFGGVGAAILGLRLLLMCGRLADSGSSNDYDYSYNPSTFPTYDPNAFAALFDASTLTPTFSPAAQHIVVARDGKAYWLDSGQVQVQAPGQEVQALGKPLAAELMPQFGSELVLADKSLVWVAGGDLDKGTTDSIVAMPLTGGAPKVIVKNVTSPEGLIADGANLWFTVIGDDDKRSLMRAPSSGGVAVKIASWDSPFELSETHDLAVDAGWVYYVYTLHDADDETIKSQNIARVSKLGGKPERIVTLPSGEIVQQLVAGNKSLYFTTSTGLDAQSLYKVPAGGGARVMAYHWEGGLGDFVVDGADVYASRHADGVWEIVRATNPDLPSNTMVSGLAREPHFGLTNESLVWSTGIETSSQSKVTSVP